MCGRLGSATLEMLRVRIHWVDNLSHEVSFVWGVILFFLLLNNAQTKTHRSSLNALNMHKLCGVFVHKINNIPFFCFIELCLMSVSEIIFFKCSFTFGYIACKYEVSESFCAYLCLFGLQPLFAFKYLEKFPEDGWKVYDPVAEYKRQVKVHEQPPKIIRKTNGLLAKWIWTPRSTQDCRLQWGV